MNQLHSSDDNIFVEVDRSIETHYMKKLAAIQDREGQVKEFTTDGCSGGLSDSWNFMTKTFPALKEKYGDKPFWEECCIEHDMAYWLGNTLNGYDNRLAADKSLQQCVVDYASTHANDLAMRLNRSESDIIDSFKTAADLMYAAVRAGGKPCSYLPWRWGYGWGHCHIIL